MKFSLNKNCKNANSPAFGVKNSSGRKLVSAAVSQALDTDIKNMEFLRDFRGNEALIARVRKMIEAECAASIEKIAEIIDKGGSILERFNEQLQTGAQRARGKGITRDQRLLAVGQKRASEAQETVKRAGDAVTTEQLER